MCLRCGCRKHDLVARYMDEHAEVIVALRELQEVAAGGDVGALRAMGARIAEALVPHNVDEERGLFPALVAAGAYEDDVARLVADHVELKRLVHEIAAGDPAPVEEFVALLRDHIHLEDNGLFPGASFVLDDQTWARLDAPA